MRFQRLYALFIARNMEFFRDRAALSWNVVMPVLLVIGITFAFSGGEKAQYTVGDYRGSSDESSLIMSFKKLRYVKFVPVTSLDAAIIKVERHQLDMLLDSENRRYWVNDDSSKGYFLEKLLGAETTPETWKKESVSGSELRYVDWVIPGILAMNMMFSSLYGVGYVIVNYRKNGVLKRLSATPLSSLEFLLAQLVSRLWIVVAINAAVFFALNLFLDFRMFGHYLTLLFVYTLGVCSLISLGLIVAARISTVEAAEGILNLISWPMMFLSGVWFSLEGGHPAVQWIAKIFPLTHVIDAARAVMLDGAGLLQITPQLLALTGMSFLFLFVGVYLFRWERD